MGLATMRGRGLGLCCLLLLVFLAACESDEAATATPVAMFATPDELVLPTPTLVGALSTVAVDPAGTSPITSPPTNEPATTPSATPSPSATPLPTVRVGLGLDLLEEENFASAAEELEAGLANPDALDAASSQTAQFGLGVAYFRDGDYALAINSFNVYLANGSGDEFDPAVYFYLGEAYWLVGNNSTAIEAYETYLSHQPALSAYIYPRIGDLYLADGEVGFALNAYASAADAPAHRLTEVENRLTLAGLYREQANYPAAIEQYDAVRALAFTENTRGEMAYLAGQMELLAGNTEAGYARLLKGLEDYPRAYDSYLGLVDLVEAGYGVDYFQRGLVDYFAGAYEPAVATLETEIETNPLYDPTTHLYLAWSYEGAGDLGSALAELDVYSAIGVTEAGAPYLASALIERGDLYWRSGQLGLAVEEFGAYGVGFPAGEQAPYAAWWSAALTAQLGDSETAISLFRQFANVHPKHEDAPEALFRAGTLAYEAGSVALAQTIWQDLLKLYPGTEFSAAGAIWLMNTLPEAEVGLVASRTLSSTVGVNYYAVRAVELAQDVPMFAPPDTHQFVFDETIEQAQTVDWLAGWLQRPISPTLGADVLADGRLVRGEVLWELGLFGAARRELDGLRQAYGNDAEVSFQLALHFRDLGLYRSSIIAAESVIILSGQSVFDVPPFLARLAYPIYFAEHIVPLAEGYGYDPLLQFALVRQESLFESFASSPVGAQGLSQVMPATGADIASQLAWPDYETDDLNRPYVGLAFGAYYIDQQLGFFDGNVPVALSAYNAGPGNAAGWYAVAGDDFDLYYETVNFPETKLYIERIYLGHVIYRFLYGG